MGRLLWALRTGIFTSGALVLVGTAIALSVMDMSFDLFWVVLVGLVAGQIIGTASETFTSYEFGFTRGIAKQAETGPATVIIAGLGLGMLSTVVPGLVVVVAMWLSYELADTYGVALAAVGMLSTLGITLATDAYGPVADNAGGIAEQAGLGPRGARAHGRPGLARQHDGGHGQGVRHRLGGAHRPRADGGLLAGHRHRLVRPLGYQRVSWDFSSGRCCRSCSPR